MPYIVAAISLIITGVFGKLWWDAEHKEITVLPPSFIEQRIKRSTLIPLTEQISKVYAVCPKDDTVLWMGGAPMYLMTWTARVNYAIDLKKVEIIENLTANGKEWIISAPEIKIQNEGNNLIDEKDHYKFNNDLLIAKSPKALEDHYKSERERANDIAYYTANWRIKNDPSLTQDIKDQLKLIFYSQISQISDKKVDYQDLKVTVEESTFVMVKPNLPSLCEKQPFKTNLAIAELSEEL
jgi:hypothetical protein